MRFRLGIVSLPTAIDLNSSMVICRKDGKSAAKKVEVSLYESPKDAQNSSNSFTVKKDLSDFLLRPLAIFYAADLLVLQ